MSASSWLLAVVEDLMFTVKILDAAKARGLTVKCVKNATAALAAVTDAPRAIMVDLNLPGLDSPALIRSLKQVSAQTPIVGFVSHVQTDLREAAAGAGADHVVPRSAFAQRLPALLDELL